mgnify:CR=1 FL=1
MSVKVGLAARHWQSLVPHFFAAYSGGYPGAGGPGAAARSEVRRGATFLGLIRGNLSVIESELIE